jgi:hypothetical protein
VGGRAPPRASPAAPDGRSGACVGGCDVRSAWRVPGVRCSGPRGGAGAGVPRVWRGCGGRCGFRGPAWPVGRLAKSRERVVASGEESSRRWDLRPCARRARGRWKNSRFAFAGVSRPDGRAVGRVAPGLSARRGPSSPQRCMRAFRALAAMRFAPRERPGPSAPRPRRPRNPAELARLRHRGAGMAGWHPGCSIIPVRDAPDASYQPSLPSPARPASRETNRAPRRPQRRGARAFGPRSLGRAPRS